MEHGVMSYRKNEMQRDDTDSFLKLCIVESDGQVGVEHWQLGTLVGNLSRIRFGFILFFCLGLVVSM